MTTRAAFLAAYRAKVMAFPWAQQNPGKATLFMSAVEETLKGGQTIWAWDGPMAKVTWKEIGCKGKMTLKGLRALP